MLQYARRVIGAAMCCTLIHNAMAVPHQEVDIMAHSGKGDMEASPHWLSVLQQASDQFGTPSSQHAQEQSLGAVASAALAGISELMDMNAQLQRRIEELEGRPTYTDASHRALQPCRRRHASRSRRSACLCFSRLTPSLHVLRCSPR